MAKTSAVVLLSMLIVACSTAPAPSPSNAVASATIKALAPGAGSEVDATTVIKAEIEYTIENFQPGSEYYLAPLFASNEGPGRTFNEFQRLTDGWKLTQPSGTVHIEYPIAREWRSPSLAKPVRVSFKIMVRTGAHTTKVIGETESIEYAPVV